MYDKRVIKLQIKENHYIMQFTKTVATLNEKGTWI